MDLVERYVQAVTERLHPARRESVAAELRASIHDALEDRGDDVSEVEIVEHLRSLGPPSRLAAGYEPERQYLIGPELFPLFRRTVNRTFGMMLVVAVGFVAVALVLGAFGEMRAGSVILRTFALLGLGVTVAMVIQIVVFAWLQQRGPSAEGTDWHPEGAWDPRSLLPVRRGPRPSKFEAISGLIIAAVVLAVLGAVGRGVSEAIGSAAPETRAFLQDVIVAGLLLLQLAILVSMAGHALALFARTRLGTVLRAAGDFAVAVVLVRIPFQIEAHRGLFIERGWDPHTFAWLQWSAVAFALTFVVIAGADWVRDLRQPRSVVRGVLSGVAFAAFLLTLSVLAAPPGLEAAIGGGGKIHVHEYRSERFDDMRSLHVYTPPGYEDASERTFPVLFLLHGVGEDSGAWIERGGAHLVLDRLILRGEVEPMVVVMPLGYGLQGGAARAGDMMNPLTDQHDVMLRFASGMLEEVVPLVERIYRVGAEPGSRAVAGLSMGGAQAVHLLLNHPEVFHEGAAFGAATIMFGGRYADWFPRMPDEAPRYANLWMTVGSEDFLLGSNRHFVDWLAREGHAVELEEVAGGHDWELWPVELARVAPRFFRAGGVPAVVDDTLPPADSIIARYVEALGGRASVLSNPVSRSEGTFEIPMLGLAGAYEAVTQAPDQMVARIMIPGMDPILRGFDGSVGWSVDPTLGARVLAGRELDAMRDNAQHLALVRDASLFRSVETLALAEEDGVPCFQVRSTWLSGRITVECFEVETGLVLSSREPMDSPVGEGEAVTRFSDYRELGGTVIATRTTLDFLGMSQVIVIRSVDRQDVDTSVLTAPEAIRSLVEGR